MGHTVDIAKLSFTGGEWAPNMGARADLPKYRTAVRRMRNMFPHPHGPASNRAGTAFITEVKNSADTAHRLLPFQFSVDQGYILLHSPGFMRVIRDHGLVSEDPTDGLKMIHKGVYQWVQSTVVASEYYLVLADGTDAGLDEPQAMYSRSTTPFPLAIPKTAAAPGTLSAGEWGYGNAGGTDIAGNHIYLRATAAGLDPDVAPDGWVTASIIQTTDQSKDLTTSEFIWAWLLSAGGEDYVVFGANGGAGIDSEPLAVYEDGLPMTPGTFASGLARGEWDWADVGFGYSSLVVRLSDGSNPANKAAGTLKAAFQQTVEESINTTDKGVFEWTVSGSGTDEYYITFIGGTDPGMGAPSATTVVYEDAGGTDNPMESGALGSLAVGEYAYGDNDALGFNSYYVRLTDTGTPDPDDHDDGYLRWTDIEQVVTPFVAADLVDLQYTQSADTMYIVHPDHVQQKLGRLTHGNWTIEAVDIGVQVASPHTLTHDASTGTGIVADYVVTSVSVSGEESLPSIPVSGKPGNVMSWVSPVQSGGTVVDHYNIYKEQNASGTFGWIGFALTNTFTEPLIDNYGIRPDYTQAPPTADHPFLDSASGNPGMVVFHQQRLVYARTDSAPRTLFGSTVGHFDNFNASFPLKADDSYTHTLSAGEMNEIAWMVSLGGLIIGTKGAEWLVTGGGDADAISPVSIFAETQSWRGSAPIRPIIIGRSVLFINYARNSVHDLTYSLDIDGFAGDDLSILAPHLFEGYKVIDWAYQKSPDSMLWIVRNDGKLLALTYYKEHEVFGWSLHDVGGDVEAITSIESAEGNTEVYILVKRTVNGSTVRYVEYFKPRMPRNSLGDYSIQDAYFVDCGISLDTPIDITAATAANPVVVTTGVAHGLTVEALISGVSQADPAVVTTSSAHGLVSTDTVDIIGIGGMTELNNRRYNITVTAPTTFSLQDIVTGLDIDSSAFTAYDSSGAAVKVQIVDLDEVVGMTEINEGQYRVIATDTTSFGLYDTASFGLGGPLDGTGFTAYVSGGEARLAFTEISGLDHLEGEDVAVLANGHVVDGLTVASGAITLPDHASRVHVGLPYVSELELLDPVIETPAGVSHGKPRSIGFVNVVLENTRGLWAGPNETDIVELKLRSDEAPGKPTRLFSGDREIPTKPGRRNANTKQARLYMKNVDPVPLTVAAVSMTVTYGDI